MKIFLVIILLICGAGVGITLANAGIDVAYIWGAGAITGILLGMLAVTERD